MEREGGGCFRGGWLEIEEATQQLQSCRCLDSVEQQTTAEQDCFGIHRGNIQKPAAGVKHHTEPLRAW